MKLMRYFPIKIATTIFHQYSKVHRLRSDIIVFMNNIDYVSDIFINFKKIEKILC